LSTQVKISIALAITVIGVLAALWQIANLRGSKARGRRRTPPDPNQQRQTDTRTLRGPEKRLYTESQKLLAQGKVAAAARILEQLNMPREAIQALEDQGLLHDAAKILMRMHRPNRAGVIYARHGMWENAAQCFKMANMPLEVAKCAREAGNYALAAEHFEKVGRAEDAASCHEQAGNLRHAARLLASVGQKQQAMALYDRLAREREDVGTLDLTDDELTQIIDYLGDGHTEAGLTAIVVRSGRLATALLGLIGKSLVKQAAELFLRSTADIGPMLMAEVSYQNRSAGCLAEMFLAVSNFHYAGMVYERMMAFDRAGDAFEKSEDFERAAYCYERAGLDVKVKRLKEKAKHAPRRPGVTGSPAFALANVPTGQDSSGFRQAAADEATAVVDMNRAQGRLPSPSPAAAEGAFDDDAPEDEIEDRLEPTNWDNDASPNPSSSRLTQRRNTAAAFSLSAAEDDERSDNNGEIASTPPPPAPPRTPGNAAAAAAPKVAFAPTLANAKADDDTASALPEPQAASSEPTAELDEGRAAFHKAKFFADLDYEQRTKLWNIGVTLTLTKDETVLTYNDEPRGIYVIIQGNVACYRHVNGQDAYVDAMEVSESFGELWLLADQPTAVRFVATKETKIRVIGRDSFNDVLDKDGALARKLYKRFTMRLLKRLLRPQNNSINKVAS